MVQAGSCSKKREVKKRDVDGTKMWWQFNDKVLWSHVFESGCLYERVWISNICHSNHECRPFYPPTHIVAKPPSSFSNHLFTPGTPGFLTSLTPTFRGFRNYGNSVIIEFEYCETTHQLLTAGTKCMTKWSQHILCEAEAPQASLSQKHRNAFRSWLLNHPFTISWFKINSWLMSRSYTSLSQSKGEFINKGTRRLPLLGGYRM